MAQSHIPHTTSLKAWLGRAHLPTGFTENWPLRDQNCALLFPAHDKLMGTGRERPTSPYRQNGENFDLFIELPRQGTSYSSQRKQMRRLQLSLPVLEELLENGTLAALGQNLHL